MFPLIFEYVVYAFYTLLGVVIGAVATWMRLRTDGPGLTVRRAAEVQMQRLSQQRLAEPFVAAPEHTQRNPPWGYQWSPEATGYPQSPGSGYGYPQPGSGYPQPPRARPDHSAKDIVVMTLNFQYFASYPKDLEKAQEKLREILSREVPPDIICVQEGLANQDVLGPVGFDLCVCSSQSGHAQSVYDMVYGDSQALATCPIEFQHVNLCNQVYIRKNSGWKVVERGSMPISSDLMLAGLGGRRHGKLAVRSMVWLKLQAPEANSPFVYVMCTHITGGRFEDQYFMQSLTEERKTQLTNIIDFYNNRVGASEEDVGIIVGDFNATTVYTSKGTMHGYFAASILPSEGVQEDAKWILTPKARERGMDVVLEEHFKEYMISPFKAITESGWTFAYDRQHVGYTSGFGHTIDHMVMSRPLLVESAEVVYMTNQKFGNKQADTDLVLTDHNAVKTTFKIDLPEKIHTFVCRTESDFLNYLKRYRAIVYITGFGQKQQYADLETAVAEVAKPLFEGAESLDVHFGKGKWVACYGGDPLDRNRTDVALLVDRLQKKYQMHLIAIQADKVEKELGVDKSIEAVYYYPTEYKKGADGGQEVAWGGYVDGKTVGTTRILLEVNPLSELPLFWIAAGGGDIAADELSSAYNNLTAVMHIECKAKFPQDPSQPFGPCLNIWNSLKDCDTIGGGDANRAWRRKEGTEG